MKTQIALFGVSILLASFQSFAKERSLSCRIMQATAHAALVAGKSFELSLDDGFAINNSYSSTVKVTSHYLGTCEGTGQENLNSGAEGLAGSAEISGPACAADGFDLFIDGYCSTARSCIVQVNSGDEAVLYGCDMAN